MVAFETFLEGSLKNLNDTKFNKKRTSNIEGKNTQIHKFLKFPFTNFLIFKLLYDNLIIIVVYYIFFKILVK